MRKVQLFIATSVDGYIACPDGSIAWLFTDADYGYDAFFEQVDTVLIGRKTFEQVLAFGDWPYPGRAAYIFSRNAAGTKAPDGISDLTVTSRSPSDVVKGLLGQPGKNIWVVGGAAISGDLLSSGLLDEMVLSVHPVVLGKGIPLVTAYSQPGPDFDYWQLVKTEAFPSGLAQLSYARRAPADQAEAPPAAEAAAAAAMPAAAATAPAASEKKAFAAQPAATTPASEVPGEPAEPRTPTAPSDCPAPKAHDVSDTDQGTLAAADSAG